jgi:hypothetical protein
MADPCNPSGILKAVYYSTRQERGLDNKYNSKGLLPNEMASHKPSPLHSPTIARERRFGSQCRALSKKNLEFEDK